jgi:hypothetical protein
MCGLLNSTRATKDAISVEHLREFLAERREGLKTLPYNFIHSQLTERKMAITIGVQNVDASGVVTWVTGTISFSGNYTTGGDTLDWTSAIEQLGQAGQALDAASPPQQVMIDSQNGNAGYYVSVQGGALNNWKVKCFVGSGTEIGAGAYPSSVTTDVIAFQAQFKRLQ